VTDWQEAPLAKTHNRKAFDCGASELNEFLHKYALQNHESGSTKTYVAQALETPNRILAYYSLCPGQIDFADVPTVASRGLARYPVSVYRLARLAVDQGSQKQGIGSEMLLLAARRAMSAAARVGGVALAIDARDEAAAAWYRDKFAALPLFDRPLRLILPFSTIAAALGAAQDAAKNNTTPGR
jgi:ribosomal protein S18 acetylase RimI-like enzyme